MFFKGRLFPERSTFSKMRRDCRAQRLGAGGAARDRAAGAGQVRRDCGPKAPMALSPRGSSIGKAIRDEKQIVFKGRLFPERSAFSKMRRDCRAAPMRRGRSLRIGQKVWDKCAGAAGQRRPRLCRPGEVRLGRLWENWAAASGRMVAYLGMRMRYS